MAIPVSVGAPTPRTGSAVPCILHCLTCAPPPAHTPEETHTHTLTQRKSNTHLLFRLKQIILIRSILTLFTHHLKAKIHHFVTCSTFMSLYFLCNCLNPQNHLAWTWEWTEPGIGCTYLLVWFSIPGEQQGPGLQEEGQAVLLHPVKQLLGGRGQSVVHLPPYLLLCTNAPPSRAAQIGGVKELRRREEKRS